MTTWNPFAPGFVHGYALPVKILHSTTPSLTANTTLSLASLLTKLVRSISSAQKSGQSLPPGATIVDMSSFLSTPPSKSTSLYTLWVTPTATPNPASLSCVGMHLQKQFFEGHTTLLMSIFNDRGEDGEEGKVGEGVGTYMVVLKRIDARVEKMSCKPVSFSKGEREAITRWVMEVEWDEVSGEEAEEVNEENVLKEQIVV